jgi:hypothetical protein
MPTEVVEQLLFAPAKIPAEIEHALTGTLTLANGLFCVVVLVPLVEFWFGSSIPAISFPRRLIGREIDTGSAVRGANGLAFEVVLVAAFGVDATVFVFVVAAGVATFGLAVVDDAAPAGTRPMNSAAASAAPPPIAPSVVRRFRLKVLLLCLGSCVQSPE